MHSMPDLPIKLVEDFLPSHADLLATLEADVAWEERVKKRPTASYGVPYNYSGLTYEEKPMHPALIPVCEQLERVVGFVPNNCLLNYYPDGSSRMGFHIDDTEHLAPGTGVAIVSVGSDRTITFRGIENREDLRERRLERRPSVLNRRGIPKAACF
jgi:alkylated DNA repair dioxygenase AlkB